jgi:hypothetical protein
MSDWLPHVNAGEFIALVAVGGGLLCGIVGIISGTWLEMRRAEIAAALKQDMLARGMSPEDIRTVLDAGTKRSGRHLKYQRCC